MTGPIPVPEPVASGAPIELTVACSRAVEAKLEARGIRWEGVVAECLRGAWLEPHGEVFALTSAKHRVLLGSCEGHDLRRPMARVITVHELLEPETGPRTAITLCVGRPWDEPVCDLRALVRRLHVPEALSMSDEAIGRRRERFREEHAGVRALHALFHLRERLEGEPPFDAEVLAVWRARGRAWGQLKVVPVPRLGEGDDVLIEGTPWTVETIGEEGLTIYSKRPGAGLTRQVRVTYRPRPRYWAHQSALKVVWDERCDRSWLALMGLLSAPEELPTAPRVEPQRWFARGGDGEPTLNEAQRDAVMLGLSMPHAAFVRGPPGTGKTTVIVELVQHLMARGERVLMLAPTHVAVDEVLRRVRDAAGVFPIRLSWRADRVSPELQPFTEGRAKETLAGKVLGTPWEAGGRGAMAARRDRLRVAWERAREGLDAEGLAREVGDDLVKAANLLCSTTTGVASNPRTKDEVFDTVIVDEASRVTATEFLIGGVRGRRWIFVGDEHQLPPYVEAADVVFVLALLVLRALEVEQVSSVEDAVDQLRHSWIALELGSPPRWDDVVTKVRELQGRLDEDEVDHALEELREVDGGDALDGPVLRAVGDHVVRSAFERWVERAPASLCARLEVQRRMVPALAHVVNQPVYGGHYRSPPEGAAGVPRPLVTPQLSEPLVLLDTSLQPLQRARPRKDGFGFVNDLEREWVVGACLRYEEALRERRERATVSVLSFYKAQADQLRRHLFRLRENDRFRAIDFEVVASIDGIQGQESDIVMLSFCRAVNSPRPGWGRWLQDVRRLNVACTRARRALVLVGHAETLRSLRGVERAEHFYANLLEVVRERGQWLKDFRPGRTP